ncbi:hypothetical protein FO519_009358 [Halicephalobus sp. NKZ332]|nr:hypothetical protein FO519_009358 [Halicephalobus sp. NKZ332]
MIYSYDIYDYMSPYLKVGKYYGNIWESYPLYEYEDSHPQFMIVRMFWFTPLLVFNFALWYDINFYITVVGFFFEFLLFLAMFSNMLKKNSEIRSYYYILTSIIGVFDMVRFFLPADYRFVPSFFLRRKFADILRCIYVVYGFFMSIFVPVCQLALTINRLTAVVVPLKHKKIWSARNSAIMITLVIAFPVLVSIPYAFRQNTGHSRPLISFLSISIGEYLKIVILFGIGLASIATIIGMAVLIRFFVVRNKSFKIAFELRLLIVVMISNIGCIGYNICQFSCSEDIDGILLPGKADLCEMVQELFTKGGSSESSPYTYESVCNTATAMKLCENYIIEGDRCVDAIAQCRNMTFEEDKGSLAYHYFDDTINSCSVEIEYDDYNNIDDNGATNILFAVAAGHYDCHKLDSTEIERLRFCLRTFERRQEMPLWRFPLYFINTDTLSTNVIAYPRDVPQYATDFRTISRYCKVIEELMTCFGQNFTSHCINGTNDETIDYLLGYNSNLQFTLVGERLLCPNNRNNITIQDLGCSLNLTKKMYFDSYRCYGRRIDNYDDNISKEYYQEPMLCQLQDVHRKCGKTIRYPDFKYGCDLFMNYKCVCTNLESEDRQYL